jgi:PAS domain S-box-containing protein
VKRVVQRLAQVRPLRRGPRAIKPFASGGGGMIAAILATFALIFVLSAVLSLMATEKSRGRAKVVEIAARQRTLAERYVQDVLLVHGGRHADPASIGSILRQSAEALLNGGEAPGVHGDDDETTLPAASGTELRNQLTEEVKLANDLTAVGGAILAGRPATFVPLTGGETIGTTDPIERLRVIAALTSNTSFNATGTIASEDDRNIGNLLTMQVALGAGGLVVSLLLAWGLIATTRRRTMHFRSLVNFSTDLVVVLGQGGCRYASRSLSGMVGLPNDELLREGFAKLVHEEDRAAIESARVNGTPHELVFRIANANGEWRHLEARVTDLREDRHVAGVVLNARDITERVLLEREVAQQAERDKFGGQLVEALEMADEESSAYTVVERAMIDISETTPMELLLSDSSRTRLERVATSPAAGAPARARLRAFQSASWGERSGSCTRRGPMERRLDPTRSTSWSRSRRRRVRASARCARSSARSCRQRLTASRACPTAARPSRSCARGTNRAAASQSRSRTSTNSSASTTSTATRRATARCACSRRRVRTRCARKTSSRAGAARSSR